VDRNRAALLIPMDQDTRQQIAARSAAELEALRLRAMTHGVPTYPYVVPVLVAEIQRLRRVVRELTMQQATRDASTPP
jgi:hypothetical protein